MILFQLFLLFNSVVLAANPVGKTNSKLNCTTINKSAIQTEFMPDRSQDGTGYCYGFAATQLLQFHFCKNNKTECQFNQKQDDRLSSLDVIASGNGENEGLVTGGQTAKVLAQIKKQGLIFKENCAPFSVIINEQRLSPDNVNEMWRYKIITAKKKFNTCASIEQHKIATQLKQQMKLKSDVQQIMIALTHFNQSQTYKELFIPEKCEKERVTIPPYAIEGSSEHSKETLLNRINKTLESGHPLAANLCAYQPNHIDSSSVPPDSCGLHALVISNVRETCCQSNCVKHYQIIDSANAFTNKQYQDGKWINEDLLFERFKRKWNDPEIGHETDLIWIKDTQ